MQRTWLLALAIVGCGGVGHEDVTRTKDSAPSLTLYINGSQTPPRIVQQGYVQLSVVSSGFTQTPMIQIFDGDQPVVWEWQADGSIASWWVDSIDNGNHTLVASTYPGSAQTATSRSVEVTVLVNGGESVGAQPYSANSSIQSLFVLGNQFVAAGYQVPAGSSGGADDWNALASRLGNAPADAVSATSLSDAFNAIEIDEWFDTAAVGFETVPGQGKNMLLDIAPSQASFALGFTTPLSSWTRVTIDAAGLDDELRGVARATNDSIDRDFLVTGYETRPGEGRNIFVARYDWNGVLAWQDSYDAGIGGDDEGGAVDNDFVAGYVTLAHPTQQRPIPRPIPIPLPNPQPIRGPLPQSSVTDKDIFVRRYDDDGNVLWTTTVDGDAHLDDVANGVAYVHDQPSWNEVYVCGSEQLNANESAIVLIKIDSSTGAVIWKQTSHPSSTTFGSGTIGGLDEATGCVVDWRGSIFVQGTQDKTNAVNNARAVTQRWSRDGKLLWQSVAPGSVSGRGITLGTNGYVVVGVQLPATTTTPVTSQLMGYLP